MKEKGSITRERGRVCISTMILEKTEAVWGTTWHKRKTTSYIVYCMDMLQPLQQSQLPALFIKCMRRIVCCRFLKKFWDGGRSCKRHSGYGFSSIKS